MENTMNEQRVQELANRIKKLLALATSNNPHEAQLALQRAQELQAKYNISVEDIEICETQESVREEALDSPDTKSLNGWFKIMAAELQDHYRVKTFIHSRYRRAGRSFEKVQTLQVVGMPQDVEVFKACFLFAYNSMKSCASVYTKNLPAHMSRSTKLVARNEYQLGYITGVTEALKENVTEKALIIVTPNAVIEYMSQKNLAKGGGFRAQFSGNEFDRSAGFRDGYDNMRAGHKRLA